MTASIVVYNNSLAEIERSLATLETSQCVALWVVVDNSASEEIKNFTASTGGIYIRTGRNVGFGAGHNIALKALGQTDAEFHLILNPDIDFDGRILPELMEVMGDAPDVGLIMPKISYADGRIQHLCKLLPAPIDLVLRRFLPGPLSRFAEKRISSYELRGLNYNAPAYVPTLSGCFMFLRRSVLDAVGGFDERFFLYMEDVDLCRRMSRISKLLYWPEVSAVHGYQMGSYRNLRLLHLHVRSAFSYFNKWGWIWDKDRRDVNKAMLNTIRKSRHAAKGELS